MISQHCELRAGDLTLRTFKTPGEVEALRSIWRSWQYHPNSDIDFYLLQNRLRPGVLRPHVMVVYRKGQPETIFVGRLQRGRISLNLGGAKVALPPGRILYFFREGLLGSHSETSSQLLVQGIMESLRRGEADVAELGHLRLDSPLYRSAIRSPGLLYRDPFPPISDHRSLSLPGSFCELMAGLRRKDRHNLRSQSNRLLNELAGQFRFHCFRREDELGQLITTVDEVARKGYQRNLGVGFVNDVQTREELRMEARNGRLSAYVLYIHDRPCAFVVGTRYQQTFYGRYMGYDPGYGKYSPGSFLLMHCMREFFTPHGRETIRNVDFGAGNQRYKRIMFGQVWQEADVDIFAPNLRALYIKVLRIALVLIYFVARSVVAKVRIRDEATSAWRAILLRKGTWAHRRMLR